MDTMDIPGFGNKRIESDQREIPSHFPGRTHTGNDHKKGDIVMLFEENVVDLCNLLPIKIRQVEYSSPCRR